MESYWIFAILEECMDCLNIIEFLNNENQQQEKELENTPFTQMKSFSKIMDNERLFVMEKMKLALNETINFEKEVILEDQRQKMAYEKEKRLKDCKLMIGELRISLSTEKTKSEIELAEIEEKLSKIHIKHVNMEKDLKARVYFDCQKFEHDINMAIESCIDSETQALKDKEFLKNECIFLERSNEDIELFLRIKISLLKEELSIAKVTYLSERKAKEEHVNRLRVEKETIQIQLNILREERNYYLDVIEKAKCEKEEIKEKRKEEEKKINAVTKVQAWWKGTMVRKGLGPYAKKRRKKIKLSTEIKNRKKQNSHLKPKKL